MLWFYGIIGCFVVFLFPIFAAFSLVELFFLIKIGSALGAFATICWCIASAVMGVQIARLQGVQVFMSSVKSLNQNKMPAGQIFEAMMLFLGGLFLLAPGFISDVLGLLLLLPFVRAYVIKSVFHKIRLQKECSNYIEYVAYKQRNRADKNSHIIDM